MTQYSLKSSSFDPTMVASVYNVGIGDGTHSYGYLFQNQGQQSPGLIEKTDVATRDALVNFGSPNLVDRDLTYFPRVSQGDFSGGGLQTVYIEPTRYFDSDLETSRPGYVTIRQQQTIVTKTAGGVAYPSIVAADGEFWFTYGDNATKVLYSFVNPASITSNVTTVIPQFLATDGYGLYYSDGTQIAVMVGVTETIVANTVNGGVYGLWVVKAGTGQYFAYYYNVLSTPTSLWKVDLSNTAAFPIAAAGHVQVPTGGIQVLFVSVVAYQNGIAILTEDGSAAGAAGDVWFHDGSAMTHIVRIEGYVPRGMANCLGDLYITADQANSTAGGAVLIKIASGAYEVVLNYAPPLSLTTTVPAVGAPAVGGDRVYFIIDQPTVDGLGGITRPYIGIYDTATAAFSHSTALSATTLTSDAGRMGVAVIGASMATARNTSAGTTKVEVSSQVQAGITYEPHSTIANWMVSSNFDFATPAIEKRFRTIEMHHAPLAAGQSITLNGYLDLDPADFIPSLTPTATVTNSVVATTSTTLSLGANTSAGHMMYFAFQLTPGTSNLTSPRVNYVTVEVGGTWAWELNFDCTSKRQLLNGQPDDQGVTGKDLYFLIRNAYENGTLLTLYLSESVSYTVTIESIEARAVPYKDHGDVPVYADQEWFVKTLLRQVA